VTRENEPGMPIRVACTGDSLTKADVSVDYLAMLRQRFAGRDYVFTNHGVNADHAYNLRRRLEPVIAEHPDVADYIGRALIDGSALGTTIFDTLAAFGMARWNQRKERGEVRPDVDLTWAALNSLVLALGTLILRGHIERQLPESFTTPSQLQRWQDAVNTLLRGGAV